MTKTERLQIRIAPELKEQLAAAAAAENRSISNYVEVLVQRAIEQHAIKRTEKSCRNCRHVCMDTNGNYKDIEGGCERWAHGGGR